MQDISAGEHTGSVPETDGLRDLTVRNFLQLPQVKLGNPVAVSYTHLTLPTIAAECRSRWSPYH